MRAAVARFVGPVAAAARREPWRSALLVGGVAVALRVLLLAISPWPFYFSDSAAYLQVAHQFYIPADRPVGLSAFYRALFEIGHDLRILAIGQTVLGVVTAVVGTVVAAQCGLRTRFARAVGLALACSPTALVYERVLLAEVLVVPMGLIALGLFLSALDRGLYGRAIVGGFVAGSITMVRTNNTVFLVALCLVALAVGRRRGLRFRAGMIAALVVSAAVPTFGYAAARYVDSAARDGEGSFDLTAFEGISLFGAYAEYTDCSDPDKPPSMRAVVCAQGPEYLNADPNTIVWGEGPVRDSLGGAQGRRKNQELRQLALENIRAHPFEVMRDTLDVAWYDLTHVDRRYAARFGDMAWSSLADQIARLFGDEAREYGDVAFGERLQDVYAGWIRVRPVIWVGAVVALATGVTRRWRWNRPALLTVGAVVLPVGSVAFSGYPTSRYLVPVEPYALLATAWVVQLAVDRWATTRASNQPGGVAVAGAPGPDAVADDGPGQEPVDVRDEFIGRVVSGRRFVDIGGLWGVVNEKVTVAAAAGASSVTMLDSMPAGHETWTQFDERAAAFGVTARTAVANLDSPEIVADYAGQFDVVHCSGILHHCPNPVHSMSQLFALTGEYLVLTSTVVPEHLETSVGTLELGVGGIRFVPYLDDGERAIVAARWGDRGLSGLLGIDQPCEWRVDDYAPWWWLFTPSALAQLARAVGFRVIDERPHWDGLAHTLLLQKPVDA